LASSGTTGAATATRVVGGTSGAAPTSGTFNTDDVVFGTDGSAWICTAGGSPGTWRSASDGTWKTYTPTTTGLTSGAASGKWRWLGPFTIHIMITVTAGTVTAGGTATTYTLPSGITADSFMRQAVSACFNANVTLLARCEASATAVTVSATDNAGANLATGTSFINVKISGVLAVQ